MLICYTVLYSANLMTRSSHVHAHYKIIIQILIVYVPGASAQCCANYGQGTGSIILDNVACTGTEASIFDCPNNGIGVHNCAHSEDVGVRCPCKISTSY